MVLLNRYEKMRMDKDAIPKAESRNRSGGKKKNEQNNKSIGGRSSPHIPSTKFRRSIGVCYRISKSVRGNAHIWSFCRSSFVWTVETQKKIFHTWQTKKTAEKIAEYLTRVSKRYGTEWEYKEGREKSEK